ncbi:Uncharacterised protein [Vibrio cholerae]|nr:Uncharacterised protein [Vibrio cholerae]CSC40475.1 Uncharacterised protein [Vibrio cholerae]
MRILVKLNTRLSSCRYSQSSKCTCTSPLSSFNTKSYCHCSALPTSLPRAVPTMSSARPSYASSAVRLIVQIR